MTNKPFNTKLFAQVVNLFQTARQNVVRSVNQTMVLTYYEKGRFHSLMAFYGSRIKERNTINGKKENIVVLIGEQASGKSTISKLVYFFKSLKEDLFSFIYDRLGLDEDIRPLFDKEIQSKFYKFFASTKHFQILK